MIDSVKMREKYKEKDKKVNFDENAKDNEKDTKNEPIERSKKASIKPKFSLKDRDPLKLNAIEDPEERDAKSFLDYKKEKIGGDSPELKKLDDANDGDNDENSGKENEENSGKENQEKNE